jgi:hypothetical protein
VGSKGKVETLTEEAAKMKTPTMPQAPQQTSPQNTEAQPNPTQAPANNPLAPPK